MLGSEGSYGGACRGLYTVPYKQKSNPIDNWSFDPVWFIPAVGLSTQLYLSLNVVVHRAGFEPAILPGRRLVLEQRRVKFYRCSERRRVRGKD